MGAPQQDRTRSQKFRCLVLAAVTFCLVAGLAFFESRRTGAVERAHRASESRALDDQFGREADRLVKRLQTLQAESVRSIATTDRRRLPAGVVSVSVWEKGPNGFVRTRGFDAEGVWEQALYRVLPAELAKTTAVAIRPVRGPELAADPSAETLRVGLFPETGSARITAIAFRPAVLFAGVSEIEGTKEYLIEDTGLVLAHSRAAEIGTRTSALADAYRNAEEKGAAAGRAHRLTAKSWEGFPTTARFTRVPGWNAYFVMEKVHAPVAAAMSPWMMLILATGTLIGFFFVALAFLRRKEIAAEPVAEKSPALAVRPTFVPERRGLRELRANPPPFVARPSAIDLPSVGITSELGKFIAAREARSETFELNRIRREKILLEEFEAEARRVRGADRLEEKLVESVSGATHSPVLFFRYDPIQGIARLVAEAGYPSAQSILGAGGMSFAMDTGLVTEIHREAARGRPKNLWDYPPLSRVMLSRLGIANFEAWPMTETRVLNAGPSRLLGILIVAESGVDSVLHRDFLGSLLERASRHYARQNA